MTSPSPKVLVFGPTGNVGQQAALTAHSQGATVYLGMRDPSKSIPGLPSSLTRVQADLSQPATLSAAVRETGATRAFIYLAFGPQDGMKASLEALKEAGVEFVVFLSSFTIGAAPFYGDVAKVTPDELIAFVHARVEKSLEEVFGDKGYVAIRAGGFATNVLRHKADITGTTGEVRMFGNEFKMDCVVPEDMGGVAGKILADGAAEKKGVYVFGPQMISMKEAVEKAAKVLGRKVKVVEIEEDEARKQMDEQGMPPPFKNYLVKKLLEVRAGKGQADNESRPNYKEGVENVKKYLGRDATGWEAWVGANKARFEA